MKRNFKIGLILGIALLMLLPVYARAQMYLTQLTGVDDVAGTMVSLSATQGDVIAFKLNSSLPNPVFSWLTYPLGATGLNTADFSWDTSSASAGSYIGLFKATTSTDVDNLVVMFTIYPSSTTSTEKITVSFASAPTSGTAGTQVTFTANAATSDQYSNDTFTYNFMWGDGSSSGFQSSLSANHPYTNTSTQTFQVTLQAKCSHGVIGQASANISITGSGGGGGTGALGTKTNPVKLDTPMPNYKTWYGYNLNYSTQYTIPMGQSVWFKVDPYGFTGKTNLGVRISVYNYYQKTNVSSYVTRVNRNTGVESTAEYITNLQGYWETAFSADEYYLIELRENGTKDQAMSIWWTFLNFVP